MEHELVNGCTMQETLEIYNKFIGNHHCYSFCMSKCEECGEETVLIGFNHYNDDFTVEFNSLTGVGELFIECGIGESEPFIEYYGDITVKSLYKLLTSLPHIGDFLLE